MSRYNKNKVVKQSNLLTTAAYSLSRNAKRILYLSLNRLADKENLVFNEEEHGYSVEISHEEYSHLFSDKKNASRDIQKAAKEMRKQAIRIYVPEEDGADGEKALKERVWIVGYDHLPRQNKTILYFNYSIVNMIPYKKGDPFTQYLLFYTSGINNPYAMRLYESICQWRAYRKTIKFAIGWMLDRFCMPPSYERMPDFRSKFLKVAVKEINENTDIRITECEEICEGVRKNTVTHIRFVWEDKIKKIESQPEPEQYLDVLEEPESFEYLGMDSAIATYEDIANNRKTPSKEELANIRAYFLQLTSEGYEFDKEFLEKMDTAEQAVFN